jgi:predicted dehydrogenase
MPPFSRRRFLEDSLIAASAALAVGAAGKVSAAEEDAPAQGSSPNERLSVAVIGSGGRGGSHLEHFRERKDADVTYICDADEQRAQAHIAAIEKSQGHRPKFVQDMREVFDDPTVDIVTTATPNHWHSLVSIWAMQAGKDVYVEKPVSHNVSEGRRMVEAARKYGRICQTGTQCRSMPGTKKAIDFIRAGGIGELKIARGLCYKRRDSIGPRACYPWPKTVDYNLWCGPSPLEPLMRERLHYDWHWQWEQGNGDLGNQGIHQMDIARWGLGIDKLSDTVLSYGGRFGYEDAGDMANTQVVEHIYGDKKLIFEVRGLETSDYRGAGVGVVFHGTTGYIVQDGYNHSTAFDLDGKVIQEFSGPGGDNIHYENFIRAVRSRNYQDLNADIEQGHLSSALCHLGNISMRLGEHLNAPDCESYLSGHQIDLETWDRFKGHLSDRAVDLGKVKLWCGVPLKIDVENETIPGNEPAQAMLTREYRKPFVVPAAGQV